MSFTSIVKNEVSKQELTKVEEIALLSAIIRNSEKSESYIKITTENASLARQVFLLIKNLFVVIPKITVRKGYNYSKNYIYILEISHGVLDILETLSLYDGTILNIPKDYLLDDIDAIRAYLKGVFLICGSVNDPKKSRYHLEFLVNSKEYADFVISLLNQFDLNSKCIKREAKYMIYVKEAEKIGDFLRIINATNSLLYYEDIRIYRDHKNMTNRLNNCEQANVDKIIMAANNQAKMIEKIQEECGLDILGDKEKVVAEYRLKYKEASLQELSEIISIETGKTITKSGVHHRMKKIEEVYRRLNGI